MRLQQQEKEFGNISEYYNSHCTHILFITESWIPTSHLPAGSQNKVGICSHSTALLKAHSSWNSPAQSRRCPSRRARKRLGYVARLPWPYGPSRTVRWMGRFPSRCPTFRPRRQLLHQFRPPLWTGNLTFRLVMTIHGSQGCTKTNNSGHTKQF